MKKGFTLIELLVVVLIIGILSAIALPQYTKAVEKSRAAEAMINLKHMKQALEVSKLSGEESPTAQDIFELSGGTWEFDGTLYCTKNFGYQIGGDGIVSAYRCATYNCQESCTTMSDYDYVIGYREDGVLACLGGATGLYNDMCSTLSLPPLQTP